MSYQDDKDFSEMEEDRVEAYYNSQDYMTLWRAPRDKKYKLLDFIFFHQERGETLTVEVKSERYSTNRMFVEVMHNGELSGAYNTKAELFVYTREDGIYSIRTDKLLNLLYLREDDGESPRTKIGENGIETDYYYVDMNEFTKIL